MRRTVWQWWTDEEGEEKGLTFSQRTPCRVRARIPGIHRAGASDMESNQSPGTRTEGLVGLAAALRDQREAG